MGPASRVLSFALALTLAACPRVEFAALPNGAPVPVVTPEQRVVIGETVVLDGAKSTDPEGDALTFRWEQTGTSGDPVQLVNAHTAVANFKAPDVPQKLFFKLVASDGVLEAPPAIVQVTVGLRANAPPTVKLKDANPKPLVGTTVVLDASESTDADGDALAFRWTQVGTGGDPIALVGADKAVATFTAPDRAQRLFFQVIVSDGLESAAPAVVTVEVGTRSNEAPVVKVKRTEIPAVFGETIVLDASETADADDDPLAFRWTQITSGGDIVTVKDAGLAVASFTAPDVAQRLYFQLVVSDGMVETNPVVVRVDVDAPPNALPEVAVKDAFQLVQPGATVVLDASDSADSDGDALTYRWEQIQTGADLVTLRNAGTPVASFTAPADPQKLYFSVTVSDARASAVPLVVRVDVAPTPNAVPVAVVKKTTIEVFPKAAVVLDASDSTDADGDTLSFRWAQAASGAEPVNLSNPLTAVAGFVAPDRPQRLFFQVIASDGRAESSPAVVQVDVVPSPNRRPVAAAAAYEISVATGATVLLDGRPSSDADGDTLTYKWEQISASGVVVQVRDATSAVATITAPGVGTRLLFRLVVSDGNAESDPVVVGVGVYGAPRVVSLPPRQGAVASPITITATAIDPDDDPIVAWRWKVKTTPVGGSACTTSPSPCLFAPDTAVVTFTPPAVGDYQLEVVANDGRLDSPPVAVNVRATSRGPRIGAVTLSSTTTPSGSPVVVTAEGTVDPDGDEIDRWVFASNPPGLFTKVTPQSARFKPARQGLHTITVYAVDANDVAGPAVEAALLVENAAPVAIAPEPRIVDNGTEVVLAGIGTDPDGDPLTYSWTLVDFPPGSRVTLAGADGRTVRFTPQKKTLAAAPADCDAGECYELELVVSDALAQSEPVRVKVVTLNRAPVASAGADAVVSVPTITLDGSASSDADGDTLESFRWTQLAGQDLTGGAGFVSGRVVSFQNVLNGVYSFKLEVSDGAATSRADDVRIEVDSSQRAPVLVLKTLRDVASSGERFLNLDASGSIDDNGDPITFRWTRTSGSTQWPAELTGSKPLLVAPDFESLMSEGSNRAEYVVTATDSAGLVATQAGKVTVYAGPGSNYVIVSNAAAANDAATPACGSASVPCQTLKRALQLVDPDGDRSGNGRIVMLTSGLYRQVWGIGFHVVPANTRIVGGYDPFSFEPGGTTEVRSESSCAGQNIALELGPSSVGVTIENVRVTTTRGGCVPGSFQPIRCENCRATLRNVSTSTSEDVCDAYGVLATGVNSDLKVIGGSFRVNRGVCGPSRAFLVTSGAKVSIEGAELLVNVTGLNVAQTLYVEDARVTVKRSVLEVTGAPTALAERFQVINASGSTLLVENSVLRAALMPAVWGVLVQGGTTSTFAYNTFLGGAFATGTGSAIRTTEALNFYGNLVQDFPAALDLANANALRSRVFGNALVRSGPGVAYCAAATPVTDTGLLNAASGTACNQSGVTWSGNIFDRCSLVDSAAGDFRLNEKVANACIDAGLASSPAGNVPAFDQREGPRPLGEAPDVGAFEVK